MFKVFRQCEHELSLSLTEKLFIQLQAISLSQGIMNDHARSKVALRYTSCVGIGMSFFLLEVTPQYPSHPSVIRMDAKQSPGFKILRDAVLYRSGQVD